MDKKTVDSQTLLFWVLHPFRHDLPFICWIPQRSMSHESPSQSETASGEPREPGRSGGMSWAESKGVEENYILHSVIPSWRCPWDWLSFSHIVSLWPWTSTQKGDHLSLKKVNSSREEIPRCWLLGVWQLPTNSLCRFRPHKINSIQQVVPHS